VNTVEIWIPKRVPSLNDLLLAKSTSRRVKVKGKPPRRVDRYNEIKKTWADVVAVFVRQQLFCPRGLCVGRCAVHFDLIEPDKRRDPDNIASAASKLILDGLVKCGTLKGDGWEYISKLSFSWRVGATPGVWVVLTPEDGEAE
jgi:hypothetical protein